MNDLYPGRNEDRISVPIFLDGPLIQNADIKASDLNVPITVLMAAAIDWYSTKLADRYRILGMDDLPQLPERPEMTNWPSQGTTAHFLLQPVDYDKLEKYMTEEGLLDADETGKKVLQCYLHGVGTGELEIDEIRSRYEADEHGFIRPEPPLPDPRDE
jgi:hypothetical protein